MSRLSRDRQGAVVPPEAIPASESRLELVGSGHELVREDFAAGVREGLTSTPKELSCAWLYDREGSRIFEEICATPEYYPTRAEKEILETYAGEIVADMPANVDLVELGSGSALKTRVLIEELLRRHGGLRYVPLDISRTMLETSSRALLEDYPKLRVLGIAAEYGDGLHALRERLEGGPRLVLWLGSTVGNFKRPAAKQFLRSLREDFDEDDRLLLGVDLRKDKRTLELAYDDPGGVTARFTRNLLERVNRELGGHFDPLAFEHSAKYDDAEGRVVMHLVSKRDQTVRIDGLDLDVEFAAGEGIHTEDSHKYSLAEIDELAAASGFALDGQWFDRAQRFSLQRLRPLVS